MVLHIPGLLPPSLVLRSHEHVVKYKVLIIFSIFYSWFHFLLVTLYDAYTRTTDYDSTFYAKSNVFSIIGIYFGDTVQKILYMHFYALAASAYYCITHGGGGLDYEQKGPLAFSTCSS